MSDEEPKPTRAIPKDVAMAICEEAMRVMVGKACGGRTYEIEIPEGMEAADIARTLSAQVVEEVEADVIRRGVKVKIRVAVVKVTTGLLVSTMQINALPRQLIQVEATAPEISVAKIVSKVGKDMDFVAVAKEIGATQSIIGESAKEAAKNVVTRASAHFQVISQWISIWQMASESISGKDLKDHDATVRSACCAAATAAFEKAWEEAPKRFHVRSFKTRDQNKRYYGYKGSRRN